MAPFPCGSDIKKEIVFMHPYDEKLLGTAMSAVGKAFNFADKHLPGGMERFYDLFVSSSVARSFDGPDARPNVNASGIELVMAVCEGAQNEALDLMLMTERRLPKEQRDRAQWCGQVLVYHQWDTGGTFRAISTYLTVDDLLALYATHRVASPRVVSLAIERSLMATAAPTRLRTFRAEAGLTQRGLAATSGVSLRSIQQYEQRKKDINHAQAISVLHQAQALNCRMEDLLEG